MFYTSDLRGGKLRFFIVILLTCGILFTLIRMVFYPIKYNDLVNQYAKQYDLDSNLVFSIIKIESKFDTFALSHKGAMGLMQITSQTGEWAAKEIGIEGYTRESLYEPDINIQIGCWYIRKLLIQYKNNLETSLAAYNAGSGNVSKWLSDKKYSKDGKSLSIIPYKETREYVKKVLRNQRLYQRLYKRTVK